MDNSGREPAGGPARPTLESLAWRYRHELAPFCAALVLASLAGIGHDYAPGWWPAAVPLGVAATAAARRWLADREPESVYVLAVGVAATTWTTVAWWAAPWHDWLFWTAVLGAVAAGIPRWWHYRRRGKVTVQRNAPRGVRRDLRRIMRHWPELSEYMELAGSHVQRAEADASGFTFTLALRAGLTAGDVLDKLARVESVLQSRPGGARVLSDSERADRVVLRVVRHDPLATTIPWPGPTATSVTEPVTLGLFETGEPVRVVLLGGHVLIGGVTGSGKSGVLKVIVAELSARPDVVLWGLDMKHGLEFLPWRPVLNRLATSESAAVDLLAAANRILDTRAEQMATRGERMWRPTPVTPALVIVTDELAELGSKALAHVERLARLGRAVAIIVVAATQRPSAAALGGLDARAQMAARIALGVIEARDGELILGTGRIGAGWRPDKLGAPGRHDQPRRARAYWLSDYAVTAAAGRPGAARPELDPASADAAAGGQKPAEQTTDTAPPAPDPDASLMGALDDAPPGGLSADELAARLGRSRAWVYKRLMVHRKAGRAVILRRGRWAARRAGRPKETL